MRLVRKALLFRLGREHRLGRRGSGRAVPRGAPSRRSPDASRWTALRRLLALLLGTLVGAGAIALALWVELAGSLPPLDGHISVSGLSAEVRVERDGLGTPTLTAANRNDLAFATGFVHGQDRFFQMDLFRRHAAGELAELVGGIALKEDKETRVHRFRHRARRRLEAMTPAEKELLERYAAGVEAGRRSLDTPPFEYAILRVAPVPWNAEDTLLVILGMYLMLQDGLGERERALGVVYEHLPAPLADFLAPRGSPWDSPLDGSKVELPPIPGPEVLDLRKRPPAWEIVPKLPTAALGEVDLGGGERDPSPTPPLRGEGLRTIAYSPSPLRGGGWGEGSSLDPREARVGSNNWAVSGRRTTHGGAILADDMHLHLMLPGVWYRASFAWGAEDGAHRLTGLTLPGTPGMVVGSNGHLAWGFTNTEGDWSDRILLEPGPDGPDSYRTPGGVRKLEIEKEIIRVKGNADQTLNVEETVWGPVIERDGKKRWALRWVAHDPEALNLGLLKLETARSVEEGLAIAPRIGSPEQNILMADDKGKIAWTVMGRIPTRVGFDGRRPGSWADGRHWKGWLAPESYPRVVDPPEGILWTANNRVVGVPQIGKIGEGGYDLGARAGQIRDALRGEGKLCEADMLALQLDDRALFLERWRKLALTVLSQGEDTERALMRREVQYGGLRADPNSVAYRLVAGFRRAVHESVLSALAQPCLKADKKFRLHDLPPAVEESVWRLVTEKPAHLLPAHYLSWDALLLDAAERVQRQIRSSGKPFPQALRGFTWGEVNRARIRHPLSEGLGPFGRLLDLDAPAESLYGDSANLPRVQAPSFGASERLAVSPGREAEGYLHLPGGQSGHPLSPHYKDGHAAWVLGRPTPFLPGPTRHTLVLTPAAGQGSP